MSDPMFMFSQYYDQAHDFISEPVDMNDPMFMFSQYYDQAQVSVESLLQIRCDWDRFSVPEETPGGNRIPDGFILPEKPSSNIWTSALKDET
ncbi:Hypothetical predicted protein [Mytilus galloprovincialis]|uniref:Uncharacterized protein n=1 Tax=Mytilus galloprovincialis TaxID=29158 RepID=A0A8B6FIF6_MYTGA|nr:Hypothetical predicted protein [Mytilus galloprovincialis]